ncbi:hypothetical protein J6590_016376 [Homalodisca vitripennis]|nr:hypothetical protein J6590_016376 [Homalodisca vitripennis]
MIETSLERMKVICVDRLDPLLQDRTLNVEGYLAQQLLSSECPELVLRSQFSYNISKKAEGLESLER